MTFDDLKNRSAARLKLSSPEALTRLGQFINERYRAIATDIGMMHVRFGTENIVTVNGVLDYTTVNLIHIQTMTYPAGNRVIPEVTFDEIRNLDPAGIRVGAPERYAKKKFNAQSVTVTLWPNPDAVYVLPTDGILKGADMSAAGDVPVLPEDFHDALIFGACAEEYIKQDKPDLSMRMDKMYAARRDALRYFVAKTAYLEFRQGQNGAWWWGPWFHNYRGFWY